MNRNQAEKEITALFGQLGRAFKSKRTGLTSNPTVYTVGQATVISGHSEASTSWLIFGDGSTWENAFRNLAVRMSTRAFNATSQAADFYELVGRMTSVPKAARERALEVSRRLRETPVLSHSDIFEH